MGTTLWHLMGTTPWHSRGHRPADPKWTPYKGTVVEVGTMQGPSPMGTTQKHQVLGTLQRETAWAPTRFLAV